jgi:hypothetical protein
MSNLMKIRAEGTGLFHADGQTHKAMEEREDGQTDRQTDRETDRQTDRHDGAHSRFSQFCKRCYESNT